MGGKGKIGDTGDLREEIGEVVKMLGERVGSRCDLDKTGEPRGLVGEISETGEVVEMIGEMVGDKSGTGIREVAGRQCEGVTAVQASLVDPGVCESVSVCVCLHVLLQCGTPNARTC